MPVYWAQLPPWLLTAVAETHPALVRGGRAERSASYLAGAAIPPGCDEPLPSPPPWAATLRYRRNQAGVRALVSSQAADAGLPRDRVTDLTIAVAELAANTLAHTSEPGTAAIWADDGFVFCQVHDSGEISDPLAGSLRPSH